MCMSPEQVRDMFPQMSIQEIADIINGVLAYRLAAENDTPFHYEAYNYETRRYETAYHSDEAHQAFLIAKAMSGDLQENYQTVLNLVRSSFRPILIPNGSPEQHPRRLTQPQSIPLNATVRPQQNALTTNKPPH